MKSTSLKEKFPNFARALENEGKELHVFMKFIGHAENTSALYTIVYAVKMNGKIIVASENELKVIYEDLSLQDEHSIESYIQRVQTSLEI